jgi:hypothetical protein
MRVQIKRGGNPRKKSQWWDRDPVPPELHVAGTDTNPSGCLSRADAGPFERSVEARCQRASQGMILHASLKMPERAVISVHMFASLRLYCYIHIPIGTGKNYRPKKITWRLYFFPVKFTRTEKFVALRNSWSRRRPPMSRETNPCCARKLQISAFERFIIVFVRFYAVSEHAWHDDSTPLKRFSRDDMPGFVRRFVSCHWA